MPCWTAYETKLMRIVFTKSQDITKYTNSVLEIHYEYVEMCTNTYFAQQLTSVVRIHGKYEYPVFWIL